MELPVWEYITFGLCVVIYSLTVMGKIVTEIHRQLVQTYGENCIDVRRWMRDFENNRRISLKDEWCNRQPADSLTVDSSYCVRDILKANNRFILEMHSPIGHVMYNFHTWCDYHKQSIMTICDCDQHTATNTQPDFGSVLIKDGKKFEGSKMCHNWFWIEYFRLNFHLIIEIFVHISWSSEFIIARPLCWEINRSNAVYYFEFCPVFDKDCLHFRKGDAGASPLWRVPIQISEPVVLLIS